MRERERERGSGTTTLSTGHYVLSRERERGSAMKAGIENEKNENERKFWKQTKEGRRKTKRPSQKIGFGGFPVSLVNRKSISFSLFFPWLYGFNFLI